MKLLTSTAVIALLVATTGAADAKALKACKIVNISSTADISIDKSKLTFASARQPEGNGNVATASARQPEGNGNVATASARQPEGSGNVTTASARQPEGSGNVTTASARRPEGSGNVTTASASMQSGATRMVYVQIDGSEPCELRIPVKPAKR